LAGSRGAHAAQEVTEDKAEDRPATQCDQLKNSTQASLSNAYVERPKCSEKRHSDPPAISSSHDAEEAQPPTRWRVCQNIDIRSTGFENSAIEAASQFQGDSMGNLWSRAGFVEHFMALSTFVMPLES